MLVIMMLFGAFFTSAAMVWAFSNHKVDVGGRVLKYAGNVPVSLDNPQGVGLLRFPKAWETFLARSGAEWTPSQAMVVMGMYGLAGFAAGVLIHAPLIGLLLGPLVLYLKLRMAQGKRLTKLNEQLPDALMLMATAIRSGLGFQQALQMVGDEGPQPLAKEFTRFAQDLSLGLSMEEALLRLQTRMASVDAEMFASALLVQRQTGGNLSEILVNLHNTIRDRQAVLGQVRTLTAQGRLSGLVLSAMPFGLAAFFLVANPKYMRVFYTDTRGMLMAGVSLLMVLMGAMVIRKIVQITL